MFQIRYNKIEIQIIVILLSLIINGCSFYKEVYVNIDKKNIKQEYKRMATLRKESLLKKKNIEELTYWYFYNDTVTFPDSLYQFQYEILDPYFYGEYGMDLYCNWYAYWINKKNKRYKDSIDREIVYQILYNVNKIIEAASGGGNGFIHESNRIPCYVEYYLFHYGIINRVNLNQEKITAAIESLWQLVDMVIDKDIPTPMLSSRMADIFKNINNIESLITSDLYLYCLINYIEKNVNTIGNE